jgi:rhodanese-related sulfurtransferase
MVNTIILCGFASLPLRETTGWIFYILFHAKKYKWSKEAKVNNSKLHIMKHFLSFLTLVLFSACSSLAQEQVNIDVNRFEKEIAEKDIQVLDVRTMDEFKTGHLQNAFLADWTKKEEFTERVAALDKMKPVYLYCLSGGRSNAAAKWLKENGFVAYNMEGGIAAWKRAGKAVEAPATVKQMSMSEYLSLIPADKTVLVDVSATWCPPCKKMKPVIDSLVKAMPGKFTLVAIDGAAQTALTSQLKVDTFPTFIIYKNGREAWRQSGIVQPSSLAAQL